MNEWKRFTPEQDEYALHDGDIWRKQDGQACRFESGKWQPIGKQAESLNMRIASDRSEQAEDSAVAENPWVYATDGWGEPQDITQHIAKVHTDRAKAQADAEWQRERRAAWVAFASACIASGRGNVEYIHVVDSRLAEFDKRFGGDK